MNIRKIYFDQEQYLIEFLLHGTKIYLKASMKKYVIREYTIIFIAWVVWFSSYIVLVNACQQRFTLAS